METKACHLCSKETGMEVRNREARKAAELKLARMDIPPRPDKVFKGNPGLPIKRVSTNLTDWS